MTAFNPEKSDIIFAAWDGAKRNRGVEVIKYSYPGCCNGVGVFYKNWLHFNDLRLIFLKFRFAEEIRA